MKKHYIALILTSLFLYNCNKVTVNKTDNKRGKWALKLLITHKSCDGISIHSQNTQEFVLDFISGNVVIFSSATQSDTLLWQMVKINEAANPSGVMIEFKHPNGVTNSKKYFILNANKKQETWL